MAKDKTTRVEIPGDLGSLSDEDLESYVNDATSEFDALDADDNTDTAGLERMQQLADSIDSARTEQGTRSEAAAAAQVQREQLRGRVHTDPDSDDAEVGEGTEDGVDADDAVAQGDLVAGGQRPRGRTNVRDVIKGSRDKLNAKLSSARKYQPAPTNSVSTNTPFDKAVLVASSDIAGYTNGGEIENMEQLVGAYKTRARALQTSRALAAYPEIRGTYKDDMGRQQYGVVGHAGDWRQAPRVPIASMMREFKYLLDDHATPEEAWNVMQAAANPEALVAAGGWCSPSEISYDFYNIVAMDGAVDLPTTGIRRGGMRWPTSPSFGDLASSTGLWHWNETQDIAAATGTAQSGSKTCARVPCAAFNEARLEGEGICITAGNLTTDAWPEQIANFLRLVNAAHFHRINTYFINQLVAQSTAVTYSNAVSGLGVAVPVLDAIEMQAIDLRTKYAMADGAVLEAIFPGWVMGLFRADLAKRKGYSDGNASFNITNQEIASWFTQRGISVQLVQDYQVRGAGQFGQSAALTSWPTSVQFLIYPAGTWVRGNGLSLDLGIIRDSTLNATNDYTAAWSEEFFLLAKIGHESRAVTVPILANGAVAADITFTGAL